MGKTAIVTGGSRGIGFGVAKQLGGEGYNIAILDINAAGEYQGNLDILKEAGVDYYYMQGSITSGEDRERFVNEVINRYGEIDVLVNNAGVAPKVRMDILDMTEESFDFVVGTNLRGTMFMTQIVVRQMLKQPIKNQKRGTIVTVTSSSVTVSSPNRAEFCCHSKRKVGAIREVVPDAQRRMTTDHLSYNRKSRRVPCGSRLLA